MCKAEGGFIPKQTFEGSWELINFTDSGVDKSSAFNKYEYLFYGIDTFLFTKDSLKAKGTYVYGNEGKIQNITLNTYDTKFRFISRKWNISTYTFSSIVMDNADTDIRKMSIELKRLK
jgi:hypothetical protein